MDMEQDQVAVAKNTFKLGGMAVLAMITSSLTALVVLVFLRGNRASRLEREAGFNSDEALGQPAVCATVSSRKPDHFSEEMVVPGVTHSGIEIEREDARNGYSSEGV